MALRWVVHTACHVLGYQNNDNDNTGVGSFHCEAITKKSSSTKVSSIEPYPSGFQMPLHYPRYSKADYETMEEWKIDMLLAQYGLSFCHGSTVDEKRAYAMGTFLWPDQY